MVAAIVLNDLNPASATLLYYLASESLAASFTVFLL